MKIWIKTGLLNEPQVIEHASQVCIMHDSGDPIVAGTIHGSSIIVSTAADGNEDFQQMLDKLGIQLTRQVEELKV